MRMNRWVMGLFSTGLLLVGCGGGQGADGALPQDDGKEDSATGASGEGLGKSAFHYMRAISEKFGQRICGSAAEADAASYVQEQFEKMGYKPEKQRFEFHDGEKKHSANIFAVKNPSARQQIIIGAHYDSVDTGLGLDDNASGVAVMLELAGQLSRFALSFKLVFVAFGCEEAELPETKKIQFYLGSAHFVKRMSEQEIDNTLVMINLDSMAIGDKMYVYSSQEDKAWFRDKSLELGKTLGIPLETNPGLNADYPYGLAGDWGDHMSFKEKGIQTASYEATNWDIGKRDGYTETERDGEIMHTERDNLDYLETNYPGRIQLRLSAFVAVILETLKAVPTGN